MEQQAILFERFFEVRGGSEKRRNSVPLAAGRKKEKRHISTLEFFSNRPDHFARNVDIKDSSIERFRLRKLKRRRYSHRRSNDYATQAFEQIDCGQ